MALARDASTLERILKGIPEGRNNAIAYARQIAFEDDRYKNLIRDLDKDLKQDLGHLCRKNAIAPQDFLADVNRAAYPIIKEAMEFARGIAQGIVAEKLPAVVHRGMLEGKKADGVADRHFTLQKEGFHVAPKGTNISVTQVNQQAAGLESFADGVKEMAEILSEAEIGDEPLQLEEGRDFIDLDVEKELEEDLV